MLFISVIILYGITKCTISAINKNKILDEQYKESHTVYKLNQYDTMSLPKEAKVIKQYNEEWILFELEGKIFLFYERYKMAALTQVK